MNVISKLTATGLCTIKVAEIDKHDALEMLSMNTKNRKIIKSNVDILRMSMNDGKWMFNGDSIVFDADGYLKSGQHRLTAFIDSNLDSITVIIVQVTTDNDILLTLNRGKSLSSGNYLSIKGVKHATKVAAVSKLVISMLSNDCVDCNSISVRCADYKIEEFFNKYIDYFYAFNCGNSKGLKAPSLSVLMYASIINNDLLEPLSNASRMVCDMDTPKGTLAHSFARINNAYLGHSTASTTLDTIRKTMSVIAFWINSGKTPEKSYGIDKQSFVREIAKYRHATA